MNTFFQKSLKFKLEYANFSKIIENLATTVEINKVPTPNKNNAKINIYGIDENDAMQICKSTFNPNIIDKNIIEIYTDDSLIYKGTITSSTFDYNKRPNIPLELQSVTNFYESSQPSKILSYKGTVSINSIFSELSQKLNKTLINNLKSNREINDIAINGSEIMKMQTLAKQYNFQIVFNNDSIILNEWNNSGPSIYTFSPESGMINFPILTKDGLQLESYCQPILFNINIGDFFDVQTSNSIVQGKYKIISCKYLLSSKIPNGNWKIQLKGEIQK